MIAVRCTTLLGYITDWMFDCRVYFQMGFWRGGATTYTVDNGGCYGRWARQSLQLVVSCSFYLTVPGKIQYHSLRHSHGRLPRGKKYRV
jgi:hypothetical protein